MSEVAGLAVGVVALAGLFADAVKCFQYVELGKSFNDDYKTYVLRLEMLGLQLSRLGEAVGLSEIDNDHGSLTIECNATETQLIQDILRHICSAFHKAEEESRKITGHKEDRPEGVRDTGLMEKLQSLSLKRIPSSEKNSFLRKTKWALRHRDTFDNLVNGLQEMILRLIKDFPPPSDAMAGAYQYDKEEVGKVGPGYDTLMKDWTDKFEEQLKAASSKSSDAEANSGTKYENTFGDRNNVAQSGNISGPNNVSFGS